MAGSSRILCLGPTDDQTISLIERLRQSSPADQAETLGNCLQDVQRSEFSGVFVLDDGSAAAGLLEAGGILEQLPDGVVLLSPGLEIMWCNKRMQELASATESLKTRNFYEAFGSPEIMGPDFCPFNTALGTGEAARSTLHIGEKCYYTVDAKPIFKDDLDIPAYLLAIVRDVSPEVVQQQKLNAIYQAGLELGDLSPEEIYEMPFADRIELLKVKILSYTQDLLEFETVEIRLVDKTTGKLESLLSVGMRPEAERRPLFASATGNGVTGFVAATGKSYLCEDTQNDPLYLPGAEGARSSLTVPLYLHEEVLGTFNVESPRPGAFNDQDLQFLELFSREVAVALNTLELLAAEKMTAATENVERLLREVAGPVDEILNDATWVLERYIGHDPDVCERLKHVLDHTREVRQLIHNVGESMQPLGRHAPPVARTERPALRTRRVLVVDADPAIRTAAHELLGRYGCVVETAHNGDEAGLMARSFHYDAAIADIRLPDMNGFEVFETLKKTSEHLPVILMTGFGYDPAHSIVKARQAGLKSVLYKPFRLDQLLAELESAVAPPASA